MNVMIREVKYFVIGCDHAAFDLKEKIKNYLIDCNMEVEDIGTNSEMSVDYPDFGIKVAQKISLNQCERGILLCGTGLGMSMVANKFTNVRAALCNDLFSAIMSRRHNDANILVMGARVIGEDLAFEIVKTWIRTPFEGGRHQLRIDKFNNIN